MQFKKFKNFRSLLDYLNWLITIFRNKKKKFIKERNQFSDALPSGHKIGPKKSRSCAEAYCELLATWIKCRKNANIEKNKFQLRQSFLGLNWSAEPILCTDYNVGCERSFSKMNLVKKELRNGLNNDTLDYLMFISINEPDEIKNFDPNPAIVNILI